MGKLTMCCCYCDAAGFLFGCLHEWREDQQSCKRCAAIFTTASYLERRSAPEACTVMLAHLVNLIKGHQLGLAHF